MDIKELSTLKVEEGDTIVVKSKDGNFTESQKEHIGRYFKAKYPKVDILILDSGIDLEIIKKAKDNK